MSEPWSEGRVWTYRPEWSWAWLPVAHGHDEFARFTILLGWPWTGRLVVAYCHCHDPECIADAEQTRIAYAAMAAEGD